jgi:nucleotide-binding universal stress UspA family protein
MKILIAIGGKEFSKPTLDLGMKIANSFKSSTTIAYVGKKISQFSEKDVSVVHQNLDDRQLYRPGIRTLEWAYDFLISKNYIQETNTNKFDDYLLVDEENSRMKVLLKEQHSDNIDLIMRTGEIIEQLKDEVEVNKHDITIIGGGGNKGIHNKLIQFIDSDVFVVKNYSVNKKYKILLPVNNSKGSDKAIDTAINFAKSYKLKVEIVAVYEDKKSHQKTEKLLSKTKGKFLKNKISATTKILDGSTVNAIVNHAKDDSIVILGVSPKNPIMKYFFGSKPISIAQKCNCPVLITK